MALGAEHRAWGKITPGEQLYSKSFRKLTLVPKFNPGGGGQRRSLSKLRAWLLLEARQEELPPSVNVWLRDAVADMEPDNLSQSDADLLIEVLFGDSRGPGPANRTPHLLTLAEADVAATRVRNVRAFWREVLGGASVVASNIDERNRETRLAMGIAGALSQDHHATVNARHPGLTCEHCFLCEQETGRAGRGDDSIYDLQDDGPYCEDCFAAHPDRFEE